MAVEGNASQLVRKFQADGSSSESSDDEFYVSGSDYQSPHQSPNVQYLTKWFIYFPKFVLCHGFFM